MGYEAACTLKIDGRTVRGTAHLEHDALLFRGADRLVIPLREATEVHALDGALHIRFGARQAVLELGAVATKWAQRITAPPSRADKLGVKTGGRVAVLGIEDQDFERELASRAVALTRAVRSGAADLVFYAANTRADLARFPELARAIAPDGAVWIVRPKGRPEITEADTLEAGRKAGLVDVKVVSFSGTHTAEKFVVPRSARAARARTAAGLTRAATRARSRRSSSARPRKS